MIQYLNSHCQQIYLFQMANSFYNILLLVNVSQVLLSSYNSLQLSTTLHDFIIIIYYQHM